MILLQTFVFLLCTPCVLLGTVARIIWTFIEGGWIWGGKLIDKVFEL